MGNPETESMCQKAMIYYYDCLSDAKDSIPDKIYSHIEHCENCQQELQWLRQADSEISSTSDSTTILAARTQHLKLHFALVDQPISCSTIKTFLPAMAIPGQQITIATPVTTHIGRCRQCAEDFAALKQMELTTSQYSDICRMFLDHSFQPAQSFTEQQVKILGQIRDRLDSGIITRFRVKDTFEVGEETSFDVEVLTGSHNIEKKLPIAENMTSLKSRQNIRLLPKRFLRPIAAAAAILMGTFLLFKNTSVQATDLSQIYEALKDVKNIVMTQYGTDSSTPLQQTLISKVRGIKLFKMNDNITLWDLNQQTKQTITNAGSPIQSTRLDKTAIGSVLETMNVPWGLLPFKNAGELPEGTIWRKIESAQPDTAAAQTEVYDLFWTEHAFTEDIEYQWRFYIDATTKHPMKIQSWKKAAQDAEYEAVILIEITYPTTEQISDMLKQTGF
jgi:hypothetical protein